MNKTLKEEIIKSRTETSLKTMYFNRFLIIRYVIAGFFFANLYWFFCLMMSHSIWAIIPGSILIILVRSIWEQCIMYSEPIDDAKNTISSFKVIFYINIGLASISFTPLFNELFPFLEDNIQSHLFVLVIAFISLGISFLSLKRLQKIKNRSDKQLKYIKQIEKKIIYQK